MPIAPDGVGRITWLIQKGDYGVGQASFETLFVDTALATVPPQRLVAALKGDAKALHDICGVLNADFDERGSADVRRLEMWLQRASAAGIADAAKRLLGVEAASISNARKEASTRSLWHTAARPDDPRLLIPNDAYSAFTREFDEVVNAADLVVPGQTDELAAQFLGRTAAADSADGSGCRPEQSASLSGTLTTILLDNSGSLRGTKLALMAALTHRLADAIVMSGGVVEILGFTTAAWKGGRSREKWQHAGKPKNPGRLNDLRHIIYKSWDEDWGTISRRCLAPLAAQDLLKENIDGEALLWAYDRSLATPAIQRNILLISDGAPEDDSTSAVNRPGYLADHLKSVVETIAAQNLVRLSVLRMADDATGLAGPIQHWSGGRLSEGFSKAWEMIIGKRN